MPQQYVRPQYGQRLSTFLMNLRPGQDKSLIMDAQVPRGGINSRDLFGATGTGTTDATAGTTTAISHNLGVVPALGEIVITPTSNGVVYLDPANPPTTTTFNVKGSAASLTFAWQIVTSLNHPSQEMV